MPSEATGSKTVCLRYALPTFGGGINPIILDTPISDPDTNWLWTQNRTLSAPHVLLIMV